MNRKAVCGTEIRMFRKQRTKFLSVFTAIAMAAALTAVLSACSLLPSYRDPASIEIGGETYVTGFYGPLWPKGIRFADGEPPAFETDHHRWWKVEGAPFSLYCAQHKEAIFWNPAVYCRESEAEAAESYYSDAENFEYYMGLYGDDSENERIKLDENADTDLLERAISLNMRMQGNAWTGLLPDGENLSGIETILPFKKVLSVQPVFYRVSKDGFFSTIQNDWLVTEDEIYIFGHYDGKTDEYTAYTIDVEASAYMRSLLVKHGLM